MSYTLTFDPADFRLRRPEFKDITDAELWQAWDEATAFFPYARYYPTNPAKAKVVMYLLVCHLLTLGLWGKDGQPGRVASATEGTVSISFTALSGAGNDEQFFDQTPCGQKFWMLTQGFPLGGVIVPSWYCDGHG